MFHKDDIKQVQSEFVCIEDLIPKDHLLRQIDKHIKFAFIYDKTRELYSEKGRPCLDVVLLFKMMFVRLQTYLDRMYLNLRDAYLISKSFLIFNVSISNN